MFIYKLLLLTYNKMCTNYMHFKKKFLFLIIIIIIIIFIIIIIKGSDLNSQLHIVNVNSKKGMFIFCLGFKNTHTHIFQISEMKRLFYILNNINVLHIKFINKNE